MLNVNVAHAVIAVVHKMSVHDTDDKINIMDGGLIAHNVLQWALAELREHNDGSVFTVGELCIVLQFADSVTDMLLVLRTVTVEK